MNKLILFVILVVLIFQLVFPVAVFAETSKGIKSAFFKFSLEDVENADDVKFTFTSISDSDKKAAVYGVSNTWNENELTYSNSQDIANGNIAGNFLGYVDIKKGTNANTIDVSSFTHLEKINHEKDSFGLAIVPVEEKGLNSNFDGETNDTFKCLGAGKAPSKNVSVDETYDYYYGGSGSGIAEISSDYSMTNGGKSLKYTSTDSRRLKFFNTFKNTELDESDLNKFYEISFYVYPVANGTITVGMMSANKGTGEANNPSTTYSTNFYDGYNSSSSQKFDVMANKWTKCSYLYKIDQKNIDERIANLTILSSCGTIYIDDLTVTKLDEFKVYSKEATEEGASLSYGLTKNFDDNADFVLKKSATDSNVSVSTGYDCYFGGNAENGRSAVLSSDYSIVSGGKSLKYTKTLSDGRLKFFNTFKTTELDETDLGKTYKVTFYVYSLTDDDITAGIMSTFNGNGSTTGPASSYTYKYYNGTFSFDIKANKWTECTFNYTIDQKNIDERIAVLTLSGANKSFYIDNISVKEVKESYSKKPYISHDGKVTYSMADTYISSNDGAKTNFGTSENLLVGNITEFTKKEAVYGSSFNFEDISSFENYIISTEENYTYEGSKSLKNEGNSCIEIPNTLKDYEIDNDDKEKEFLVSFYVKAKDECTIKAGYDTEKEFNIPKDKWVKVKFNYTITSDAIEGKKDVLKITHPSTVYIDDINVVMLPLKAYNYAPINVECHSVIYKTKNGNDAFNLVNEGSIDRVFVTNNTGKKVNVIVALYENDILKNAKTLEVMYDGSYDVKMSLPEDVTNAEVKVFAFDKSNNSPLVTSASNSQKDTKATFYTVGDSLMQTCDVNTSSQRGWTQMLDLAGYFNENLALNNTFAKGGASTATAISGGTLKSVIDKLKPGDFIIFQFGHNDDYRKLTEPGYGKSFFNNFKSFVEGARSKGAYVLVATSVARFDFNSDGSVLTKMDGFMDTTRLIGTLFDVPVIDLHELTKNDIDGKKTEYREHYLSDNRHLSETGAKWVCDNFVSELKRLNHPLCKYLTK